MTDDLRPPYRIAFDNARDPYAARNALGIAGTGAGLITSVTAPLSVTGGNLTIDLSGYQTRAGTTTNDNAPAGHVGEYIESLIPVGSKVALTSGIAANVTSISLTAGDWDAWAVVQYDGGATTTVTALYTAINTTSATVDFTPGRYAVLSGGGAAIVPNLPTVPLVPVRFSIASSTTVYLVTTAIFGTSTLGAYGRLMARRRR